MIPLSPTWRVFLLALSARLLLLALALDYPLLHIPQVDEAYYLEQARQWLAGTWGAGPLFMDPLYPLLLALASGPGAEWTLIPRLLQAGVDAATAVLMVRLGRHLWSPRVGLVAGLLYAVHPIAGFYTTTLLKTTLTTFAATGLVWQVVRLVERRATATAWGLWGVMAGVAVYLRGTLLLLIPLALFHLAWLEGRREPRAGLLSRLAAGALGAALVLGAVGSWQWRAHGAFTPLPTTAGITLYSANHRENPDGTLRAPPFVTTNHPGQLAQQFLEEAQRRSGKPLTLPQAADYWSREAWREMRGHPREALQRLAWKGAYLFTAREIPNNHDITLAARYIPPLAPGVPWFAIALGLGVPGLWLGIRATPRAAALLLPLLMTLAVGILYFATARFRLPMLPPLLLGGAYLLAAPWWRGLPWRQRVSPPLAAAGLLLLSLVLPAPDDPSQRLSLNLALAHSQLGEPQEALAILHALPAEARQGQGYGTVLGHALLAAGRYPESLAASSRALARDPESPTLRHNAALAALEAGQPALAAHHFRLLLARTGSPEHHGWLGVALWAGGEPQAALPHLKRAISRAEALPAPLTHRVRTLLANREHPTTP